MRHDIIKYFRFFSGTLVLTLLCAACSFASENVSIPTESSIARDDMGMQYSTDDFRYGEWTIDTIQTFLKDQGFENIEVIEKKSEYVDKIMLLVRVEDDSSNSDVAQYRYFERGEIIEPWEKIQIEVSIPVPKTTQTGMSNAQIAEYLAKQNGSESDVEQWKKFMTDHNGEKIEFDGNVTYVYDELFFASGITVSVSFEGNEDVILSKRGISPNDIGFGNEYACGSLEVGTPVHCKMKIVSTREGGYCELLSIKLIN